MEYLDVLNEKGNKTGKQILYEEAHEKGFIHRAVHVWVLNPKGELLIQKRSKDRRARAGFWDISASGHVSTGQTSLEAAQKEVEEELGIKIPESKFEYLFTVEDHLVLNNNTYINNEFQDVYLTRIGLDISDIKLTDGEVEEVRCLNMDEFRKWISGRGEKMVPHKEEYEKLIEYLETSSNMSPNIVH